MFEVGPTSRRQRGTGTREVQKGPSLNLGRKGPEKWAVLVLGTSSFTLFNTLSIWDYPSNAKLEWLSCLVCYRVPLFAAGEENFKLVTTHWDTVEPKRQFLSFLWSGGGTLLDFILNFWSLDFCRGSPNYDLRSHISLFGLTKDVNFF